MASRDIGITPEEAQVLANYRGFIRSFSKARTDGHALSCKVLGFDGKQTLTVRPPGHNTPVLVPISHVKVHTSICDLIKGLTQALEEARLKAEARLKPAPEAQPPRATPLPPEPPPAPAPPPPEKERPTPMAPPPAQGSRPNNHLTFNEKVKLLDWMRKNQARFTQEKVSREQAAKIATVELGMKVSPNNLNFASTKPNAALHHKWPRRNMGPRKPSDTLCTLIVAIDHLARQLDAKEILNLPSWKNLQSLAEGSPAALELLDLLTRSKTP